MCFREHTRYRRCRRRSRQRGPRSFPQAPCNTALACPLGPALRQTRHCREYYTSAQRKRTTHTRRGHSRQVPSCRRHRLCPLRDRKACLVVRVCWYKRLLGRSPAAPRCRMLRCESEYSYSRLAHIRPLPAFAFRQFPGTRLAFVDATRRLGCEESGPHSPSIPCVRALRTQSGSVQALRLATPRNRTRAQPGCRAGQAKYRGRGSGRSLAHTGAHPESSCVR